MFKYVTIQIEVMVLVNAYEDWNDKAYLDEAVELAEMAISDDEIQLVNQDKAKLISIINGD